MVFDIKFDQHYSRIINELNDLFVSDPNLNLKILASMKTSINPRDFNKNTIDQFFITYVGLLERF